MKSLLGIILISLLFASTLSLANSDHWNLGATKTGQPFTDGQAAFTLKGIDVAGQETREIRGYFVPQPNGTVEFLNQFDQKECIRVDIDPALLQRIPDAQTQFVGFLDRSVPAKKVDGAFWLIPHPGKKLQVVLLPGTGWPTRCFVTD